MGRRERRATPAPRRRLAPPLLALLACAVVLLLSMDERPAASSSDECQTVYTSVALAETGELGLSPYPSLFSLFRRADGEYLSRYGMAPALLQLPAALAAPHVERRLGPGTSLPLFILSPLLLVVASAWAAGRLVRALGGGEREETAAVVLAALGSPLGSYAGTCLSEPAQALALSGALLAAVASAREESGPRSTRLAALAGASAGLAVLAKSVLLVVSPFLLLPLLAAAPPATRRSRLAAASAGAALALAPWLAFELLRFGAPFTSYGGETFSYPLLQGLWRLAVGPNRGLVLFFPASLLAAWALARSGFSRPAATTAPGLAALATTAAFSLLLLTSATWWAWHGIIGWGPRFLVPALPILAAWGALATARWTRAALVALLGASIALNLPPLLASPLAVGRFEAQSGRVPVGEAASRRLPGSVLVRAPGGSLTAPAPALLAETALAAPHRVYPWFLAATDAGSPEAVAKRLQSPPWLRDLPAAVPPPWTASPEAIPSFAPPPRWNGWGRTFLVGLRDPAVTPAYLDALTVQVLRALRTSRTERAVDLARRLVEISPGGESDVLWVESCRRQRMYETASDFVGSLRGVRRANPRLHVAVALLARDRGLAAIARQALEAAAKDLPASPAASFASRPLAEWPADLFAMTERGVRADVIEPRLPGLGR